MLYIDCFAKENAERFIQVFLKDAPCANESSACLRVQPQNMRS